VPAYAQRNTFRHRPDFLNGDPSWEFSKAKFLGYNRSKVAVNMLTVQLAAELYDAGIKVNSADPGFTATDLNAHRGRQIIPEGAAAAVRLALLPEYGPTETFSARIRRSRVRRIDTGWA